MTVKIQPVALKPPKPCVCGRGNKVQFKSRCNKCLNEKRVARARLQRAGIAPRNKGRPRSHNAERCNCPDITCSGVTCTYLRPV